MPYKIPQRVATTTALAAGGMQPVAGLPPIPASAAFQDIFTAALQMLAPGASVAVAWPAVPAGQSGFVTALAFASSDPTVVTYQTRVNGIGKGPYATAHLGDLGTIVAPFFLPVGIKLAAGDVFDIFVTNTGAAPITFQTRALGAFFL
jgi:hypothetical protein